jgi:hypothetical protein
MSPVVAYSRAFQQRAAKEMALLQDALAITEMPKTVLRDRIDL